MKEAKRLIYAAKNLSLSLYINQLNRAYEFNEVKFRYI